ncbi:hypothetical protein [Streptomyces sp. YIM B13518]|uniref:hypothetical protein n=1 Tax=Streptomyces sp. YIM B13518 TaxID=3366316 RepID=UPI0036C6FA3F
MPAFRRAVARCVDFAPVVTPAAVLTSDRVSTLVTGVPELAARGGLDLLTSRGDVLDASEGLGLPPWSTSVLYVEQAFGLLVVAAFLHRWACRALLGRTAGKGLTGLRITPRGPGAAARRAAVTTAADVAVCAVARVLLTEGRFALPVPGPGRRSLADRVAGTPVTGPGLSRPDAMRPVRTS